MATKPSSRARARTPSRAKQPGASAKTAELAFEAPPALRLKLGLPKGSLQEATVKLFARAGFRVHISERSYAPAIDDPEIDPMLIRAQEMSRYVQDGVLDCGITGKDWILENGSIVASMAELVYAKRTSSPVRWVLAVPAESSIRTLNDLKGKRIATELVGVTKKYFQDRKIPVTVEFSWGATEGKVRAGIVDAVVELTETGQTLSANGLRIMTTICESTTQLIANPRALADPWKRRKIEHLKLLLLGAVEADGKVGVKLNVSERKLPRVMGVLPALKRPTVSKLWGSNSRDPWWAVEVVIDERQIKQLVPKLKDAGATDIIEYPLNKVIY